MRATEKENKAIEECYVELYKNSTPSADFNKLLEEAEENERGEKVIDFDSYEIEESKFNEIIESIIIKYKIKPKYRVEAFKSSMYLGVSPKFKK